ncbi:MAG: NmrA family NAD(P)-binding protein [Anaerolineales bacterium]|nr:NmrA family NAD(P)-binding protein [Anaerolineales bacterium]MDP2975658.1 NmrA family NAD(P)-binding protein [Anaerolineales bacterium]MDP3184216.1 NmrA family NAD(P)-binding protein [Anaerolineales bacterium]
MILVTGGTGFIGRALVRHLAQAGHQVRTLLRPSPRTPNLPLGVPVEVAVTSLSDERGLRAAMRGVDVVYHMAGGEAQGGRANLMAVDIEGTRNLVRAAADARIQRLFYLSHLDADRASGFPVLKAKGVAEETIRQSGLPHTILRASILYGPQDTFTTGLAMLLTIAPGSLPLPGHGKGLLQPLWVEDMVTCLIWALDETATINQTYEVGGSEYFSLSQIAEIIMGVIKKRRALTSWPIPYLRALTVILETTFPHFPSSVFWLDYLAVNRTCALDTIPRVFGLMPARFATHIDYLRGVNWHREFLRSLFTRHA